MPNTRDGQPSRGLVELLLDYSPPRLVPAARQAAASLPGTEGVTDVQRQLATLRDGLRKVPCLSAHRTLLGKLLGKSTNGKTGGGT